jgi:cytochrome c peroxidase
LCRTLLLSGGMALGCPGCKKPARPGPAVAHPPPYSAAARSFYADRFSRRATVAEMTELGRARFFDPSLSASGQMSCATCHDPRVGFGPPSGRSVEMGGPDGKAPGMRAVPSLRYLQTVPPFEGHHFDEAVEDSTDQGPTGGHTWDGRADSTHDQARAPLTSPFEMANPDVATVVRRVAQGPLAARFRAAFGADVFDDATRAETAVLKCLEVFQQSPKDFYPYSSRYDRFLRGTGQLTAAEQRGLALFNDPAKGGCASCHPSTIRKGAFPQFTDYGFNAIGVPRNRDIPANRDRNHYDLGLCGPLRQGLADKHQYCGFFRVPPLQNVAVRRGDRPFKLRV